MCQKVEATYLLNTKTNNLLRRICKDSFSKKLEKTENICQIILIFRDPSPESKGKYSQIYVVDHVVRANLVNLGTSICQCEFVEGRN